jgi:hypothetical protein
MNDYTVQLFSIAIELAGASTTLFDEKHLPAKMITKKNG